MAEQGFKRKLTAILSADVAGYSRLMAEDETFTVKTIAIYREVFASLIKQHRGRVVDSPGDNVLAEFSSVVDAVQCAVAVQQEIQTRNAELPDNRRMEFRIGVNLGDVIDEEERIYGNGVNIAARLEAMADPGGLCVSKTAFDQIETKLPLGYEYLGEQSVKNIPKPVGAYRVLMKPDAVGKVIGEKRFLGRFSRKAALAAIVILVVVAGGLAGWNIYLQQSKNVEPASVEKMAFPLPEKPSIAVLPFDNMSGDPRKEYISDGITEQLIAILSKLPRVFVISRTSTFSYKGKPVKVQQVAEELGVRYVLEGSFQQSGDKVRITAQLIDALTGRHLWADRYESDYKDIFAIQDEISFKILGKIGVTLTEGERSRTRPKKLPNLDAFEKFMEAITYLRAFNIEDNNTARRLAEEIIAIEPEWDQSYNLLASVNFMDVWLGSSKSPSKSLAQAAELSKKAIELNENNSDAYSHLCNIFGMQRQFDKAVAAGKKAIEINPNSDHAYVWLARTLNWMGKSEEAINLCKRAIRLCPFPPSYYYLDLGTAYRTMGQYEKAVIEYKKALHLTPKNIMAFISLAICYGLSGLELESQEAAQEILKLNPNYNTKFFMRTMYPFKNQELVKSWADALHKAGIPQG